MRRLSLFSVVTLLMCSVSAAQVDLIVDQSQSNASFEVAGSTDSSSVTGSGSIEFDSIVPPFSTAQLTALDLTLADGFDISFLGGLVSIDAAPGSVAISLSNPGAAGMLDGSNQFDQLGNFVDLTGVVSIFDPIGLAGGSMTLNLAEVGAIPIDFNDVQVTVDGSDLTVSTNINLDLDANGNSVLVTATVVANGKVPTILLADVNLDGVVNLLDVAPFIDLLTSGTFQIEADMNQDGSVNLLDVQLFVDAIAGG